MIKGTIIFLVGILLLSAGSVFGKTHNKILVYYFKNISSEEKYVDLIYRIPLYVQRSLKEELKRNKVILIDEEGLELYREDSASDLWDRGALLKIGKKRNIDEILFGAFYIQGGKPVVVGKVFYIKNGLILDVDRENGKYAQALKKVESLDANALMGYGQNNKVHGYRPPLGRILETGSIRSNTALNVCAGTLYPLGEWSDLYPPGILSEISVIHFPKINRFPAGLGVNSNYVILNREAESGFVDSHVSIIAVGGYFQYIFQMSRFIKGISLDATTGLAISDLLISGESWSSVDPYLKIGVTMIARPFNLWDMTFKIGIFSIDYKQKPMDALYTEIGLLVF
jgi:hypothetical protein